MVGVWVVIGLLVAFASRSPYVPVFALTPTAPPAMRPALKRGPLSTSTACAPRSSMRIMNTRLGRVFVSPDPDSVTAVWMPGVDATACWSVITHGDRSLATSLASALDRGLRWMTVPTRARTTTAQWLACTSPTAETRAPSSKSSAWRAVRSSPTPVERPDGGRWTPERSQASVRRFRASHPSAGVSRSRQGSPHRSRNFGRFLPHRDDVDSADGLTRTSEMALLSTSETTLERVCGLFGDDPSAWRSHPLVSATSARRREWPAEKVPG